MNYRIIKSADSAASRLFLSVEYPECLLKLQHPLSPAIFDQAHARRQAVVEDIFQQLCQGVFCCPILATMNRTGLVQVF